MGASRSDPNSSIQKQAAVLGNNSYALTIHNAITKITIKVKIINIKSA